MMRMLSPQSPVHSKWKKILDHHVENPQARSNFRDTFRSCSEECCSLLADMLHVDDRTRATAAQCYRSLAKPFTRPLCYKQAPSKTTPPHLSVRHAFIQPQPPVVGVVDIVDRASLEASIGDPHTEHSQSLAPGLHIRRLLTRRQA